MQIDIERNALGVLLTPPGWAEPETPLRLASLPVTGGQLVFDPAKPAALPAGLLTDPPAAAIWLADVYGEDIEAAVLDGETTAAAEPGPLAPTLARLARAIWLQRWWHPEADQRVDLDLLAAEIGALSLAAAICFEDDDLAIAELTRGVNGILRLPGAIVDRTGAEREFLDEALAELVDGALRFADEDHPGYPLLADLAAGLSAEQTLSEELNAGLDAFLAAATTTPAGALHAGAGGLTTGEERSDTVDWLLVPTRSTSGRERNVLAAVTPDDQLVVRVETGLEPVPRVIALVFAGKDALPARVLELPLDGAVYQAALPWDDDLPDEIVITRAPLGHDDTHRPRPAAVARADRDYVRAVVAAQSLLATEVLAS